MPSDDRLRRRIISASVARFSSSEEERRQALREYLAAARPDVDPATAEALATGAPALLPSFYNRWANMFASRMFETVPREQIEYLCDGSEDNDAALALAFIMFLESERMEKQVAEDLQALEPFAGGLSGEEAVGFVLARRRDLAEENLREQQKKAGQYLAERKKKKQ